MRPSTAIIRWLFSALVFGLIVTVITLVVAWRDIRAHSNVRFNQERSFRNLRIARDAVKKFQEDEGRTLTDVSLLKGKYQDQFNIPLDESGHPVDYFGDPLIFFPDEHNPKFVSYGEDGKPGGIGLDRDLSSDDTMVPYLTFPEFIQSRYVALAAANSFKAGGLAAIVFLIAVWPRQFATKIKLPWIRMTIVAIAAVILSSLITAVQLSGH